jgi:hypothetical protein
VSRASTPSASRTDDAPILSAGGRRAGSERRHARRRAGPGCCPLCGAVQGSLGATGRRWWTGRRDGEW